MKFKLIQPTKLLFAALMITILFCGTSQVTVIPVFAQAPGVIVFISSDTTWTKADSPVIFTGPFVVSNGVTLTIEAGVTVDLNSYYLLVNGTLRLLGSSSEQVFIENGERIEFTDYSSDWNEVGSGCILEAAETHVTIILNSASPKIDNCVFYNRIILEGNSSPQILNNELSTIQLGQSPSSPIISNNNISIIYLGQNNIVMGEPIISNNNIRRIGEDMQMSIYSLNQAGAPTVSNNKIYGSFPYGDLKLAAKSPIISNNVVVDGEISIAAVSPVITNNVVNGLIEIIGCEGSLIISNNVITPPTRVIDSGVWVMPNYTERYFGIVLEGYNKVVDVLISNNTISGALSGIKLGNLAGSVTIEKNVISNNVEDGINVVSHIDLTVEKNVIHKNGANGIKDYLGIANMVIRDNTITNNNHGISDPGPSSVIERNLIDNNHVGVELGSQGTVRNNTITNTDVAVRLHNCPSATINYNNIENYLDNSLYLVETSGSIDVINNWWGTADIQTVNLTIYDYKYDLALGKVEIISLLSEPNPEAMPNKNPENPLSDIPEFLSYLFLPLFLLISSAVVGFRKNFGGRFS